MSGYIPRDREPISREQWIAIVVAIISGILIMFIALYASRVAMGWLGTIGKIPVGAPVVIILASSLLIQTSASRTDGESPRPGPRFRRYYAFFLYALGAAMFALPFVVGSR